MNKIFKRILLILGGILAFILVAIIITIVVTGITLHNAEKTLGTSSELATEVSVTELVQNPKNYDGKFVRVRGIFMCDLECLAIFPAEDEYNNKSTPADSEFLSGSIWLNDTGLKSTYGVNLQDLYYYRGKHIVIEGNFNPWKNGHFDCYAGTIENISYVSIEKGRKKYMFEYKSFRDLLGYWFENNFPSPINLWQILV